MDLILPLCLLFILHFPSLSHSLAWLAWSLLLSLLRAKTVSCDMSAPVCLLLAHLRPKLPLLPFLFIHKYLLLFMFFFSFYHLSTYNLITFYLPLSFHLYPQNYVLIHKVSPMSLSSQWWLIINFRYDWHYAIFTNLFLANNTCCRQHSTLRGGQGHSLLPWKPIY